MVSQEYSTVRKHLHSIARLANSEAALDFETQDAIARASFAALRELDALEARTGKEVACDEATATLLRA
jgi:hypothetical protein